MAEAEAATTTARFTARRLLVLAVLALALVVGVAAAQSLGPSAIYYLTPTEAREQRIQTGRAVRLGGLVQDGSLRYDPATRALSFSLTDGTTAVRVSGNGAPPALLREGAGAVVEGEFGPDGTFLASSVIAKHDEKYAPPSPGATPKHTAP